jgi:hypothetical protein
MKSSEHLLWEYVRGDLTQAEFEKMFLSDLSFQDFFGEALWLEIASADYRDANITFGIKENLKVFLSEHYPQECKCLEIRNVDVLDMFKAVDSELKTIEKIMDRGDCLWWLYLSKCTICHQYWLVAQEERQNDVFILKRLNAAQSSKILTSNIWPPDFDQYENLLSIGKVFGHSVRFVDPVGSLSLNATVEDLAREKPGIHLSQIASLLNLDIETATIICSNVIKTTGVVINLKE